MTATYFSLASGPLLQDWSNTGLITANDDWSGVPSVVGFLGDISSSSTTNVDPQTLTAAALGAIDVIANQTNPDGLSNGGVAEFDAIANPTVALNGSGTADAPSLVLHLDATGRQDVHVAFNARDIDGSVDNSVQQLAVQYRIGDGGSWINVPNGYFADVSAGPSLTQSTPIDVVLPAAADGQAQIQVRILTTNAGGNDEWIGIDDINVSSSPAGGGGGEDTTAPTLVSSSPSDGATGVAPGTDIVLTFSEPVQAVSGDLTVTDGAGDTRVITLGGADPDGSVDVNGSTVTIDLAADLAFGTTYDVVVPAGALEDLAGNDFDGIALDALDFTTASLTLISTVQGAGAASALVGQMVTIEAIVVGDFQDGDADAKRNLNGFYLQEEAADSDGNAATSEGIFVFGGATDVHIGDRVLVTGTVTEYFGLTEISSPTITVVQPSAVADVHDLAVSIDLPAPAVTLNQNGQYQPDLEAFEGMLVTFTDTLTISEQFNLDRSNEIRLVAGDRPVQFTQANEPSVAGYEAERQEVGARTITYDDGLNDQNASIANLDGYAPYDTTTAPRMGDQVSNLTGVLDYQWAGFSSSGSTWRVRAVEDGDNTFVSVNEREASPPDVGGTLKVGNFNVLNFFKTLDTSSSAQTAIGLEPRGANNATELGRQTEKLVNTIAALDPDVLGLVELENDFLPGSSGNAIEYLVSQLNAKLGAGTYAWVNPGSQFVGGDAIAVGFIYRPSMVQIAAGTSVESLDDSDLGGLGLANLIAQSTVGGVFNGLNTSRSSLAVTFEEVATGEDFTAIVNHLKSKSGTGTGADADQLDGQGAWQQQRELAAQALTAWAASDPTGSGDSDVLLLGDFNAYFQEDAIDLVKAAGYENLAETRIADPYSYVFDGRVGTLDYGFANTTLASQITGIGEWHINADEADALDYNLDFGRDPAIFDAEIIARESDHDPLIIGLALGVSGDDQGNRIFGTAGNDVIYGQGGSDKIFGKAGNDKLFGNDGNDKLYGDSGNDTLNGGAGRDTLDGGLGNDSLDGGDNNDRLDGGLGNDLLIGGDGHDRLCGDLGNDTGLGGNGDDFLDGGLGNDSLDGGNDNDFLVGDLGNDYLNGGAGRDTLWGVTGRDTLEGGDGNDLLRGGLGVDIFVFTPGCDADTTTDFRIGRDFLDVRAFHFPSTAAVLAQTAQVGFNAVIDLDGLPGGDQVTLIGVSKAFLGGSFLI